MNALPIDLKASTLNLPANRVASGMGAKGAEEFSRAFQDSLDAIAEKSQPAVSEDKPAEEKPQKELDEKVGRDTAEASQEKIQEQTQGQVQGQNMPADADNLPAKVAEMLPVVSPVNATLGQVGAGDLAAGDNLVGVDAVQPGMTSVQSINMGALNLAAEAPKPEALNAQSTALAAAGLEMPQSPAAHPAQRFTNIAAQETGGAQVAGAGVPLQALPTLGDGASATEALLQPQKAAQIVLASAGAQEARLDQRAAARLVATPTPGLLVGADAGATAAEGPGIGALASTAVPAAPTFADLVLADTLSGTGGQVAAAPVLMASRPVELALDMPAPLTQVVDESALADDVATDFAGADDVVPLAGLAVPAGAAATSPGVPAASVPTQAPVMMVPAAGLNTEIVKFAGAGGGRAVMEITSPELGALKIDLSIDGKGVARMVVEATTSAARDQLEQGVRRLHDDFANLGLSLNVDVRQGGSGTSGRESWAQPQYSGAFNAASAALNDGIQSVALVRGEGATDDKSRIHFYA